MPLVRGVYSALKQIFETVLSNKDDMFRQVGLVEYPRKGVWSLVFVANEKRQRDQREARQGGDDPLVAVFMPCTPNPTTGFLMYVCRVRDRRLLDMTIEDGAKLIVSAGLVAPEYRVAGPRPADEVRFANRRRQSLGGYRQPSEYRTQPARSSRTASSRPKR